MCINWPHDITGPSEWDRLSVRGEERQESHMKETETTSLILPLQFSIIKIVFTWKFDLLLWPIVTYCLPYFFFVVDRKWAFLEHNSAEATLCKLFARTSVEYISCETLLSACFHNLMHEYRIPDSAVNAQYVYSTTTAFRVQAVWAPLVRNLSPWTRNSCRHRNYGTRSVLQYVYSVEVCH